LATTLALSRSHFTWRMAITAEKVDQVAKKLLAADISTKVIRDDCRVAFLFPGQGSQYPQMTLALYHQRADYRDWLDQAARCLHRHLDVDLLTLLESD